MVLPLGCSLARALPAQTVSAEQTVVTGNVTDTSGARVPGARVHLQGQGVSRDTTADPVGHFSLRMPTGSYAVTVTAPGFLVLQRERIAVGPPPRVELTFTLQIDATTAEVNVDAAELDTTDEGSNQTAVTLSGATLATLSDDDTTFQQQITAMAGGGDSTGGQLLVDGFSGGRFPPKTAIREIRINSNPFSAEYDSLGFGRIEIFTKPGADTFHGSFDVGGSDGGFNARNPYTGAQPPYHDLYYDTFLTGPLGRKTSFFASGNRIDQQNNAVVNAVILNGNLQDTPLSQAVPNPQTNDTASVRLDRQIAANNVLTGRYEWNNSGQFNSGVGLLVLPSEGLTTSTTTQTLQLSDTETVGAATVLETRFEYIRTRLRQTPASTAPTLVVEGSFSGGGSGSQTATDSQDHYELQEYVSRVLGKHFLRLGGRFRANREANTSTGGYNGAYTFPSLAAYQITVQGLAQGLTPAAIRAAGGGASQFNLTAGSPSAEVSSEDLGVYAEDEWKLRKDLTVDLGFRAETQTAIPDHFDPAPRVGLAYSVAHGKKEPVAVFRTGFGMFYDRFDLGSLLTAVRQNGTSQSAYFVQNPDFYPAVPAATGLPATEPTLYRVSPRLHAEYAMTGSFSAEHSFGEKGSISATYLSVRRVHQYLSRNVNAPLPGTYNPADPTSGIRPLGGTQNIYEFSSDGIRRGEVMFANVDLNPTKRLSVWAFYNVQRRRADSFGAGSFPSNEYDLAQDYGRITTPSQRIFAGAWYNAARGFQGGLFLRANSGTPYNITTGTDLNGDTQYNDRPAFATDLTRASVVRTRLGNFDTQPIAGQTIIPIDYGTSPAFVSLQITAAKEFHFGPRPAPEAAGPGHPVAPGNPLPEPRYQLRFSAEAGNVLNHTNPGVPVGILSSPFFGQSISLADNFSGITAANRALILHSRFSF